MAGTNKVNVIQLGDSVTATQNAVLRTNQDGTFTLARGNAGATTQDLLTFDVNGRVAMPQTVVAFSAYAAIATSLANNAFTKVTFGTEEFDTTNAFDNVTNHRFTPVVAGYYQISGSIGMVSSAAAATPSIYKNGVRFKDGVQGGSVAASLSAPVVSALVYMNGSTDYIELWGFQNSGGAINTATNLFNTYFQGILVAKA